MDITYEHKGQPLVLNDLSIGDVFTIEEHGAYMMKTQKRCVILHGERVGEEIDLNYDKIVKPAKALLTITIIKRAKHPWP